MEEKPQAKNSAPGKSSKKYTAQETIQIYTDWANHYLEKNRSKRHITDLQSDVTDGVILGDVIEAVTGQKVPDLNKKPKNTSQMLDNISAALNFLGSLGVELSGLTAKDIRDGNLKSILSLFFALSRFKQQQKQAQQERRELEKLREKKQESEMAANVSSRLGSPYKGQNGCGSAIPTPALGGRKHSADHHSRGTSRSATPSSGSLSGSQLKGIPSTSSSRSVSPSNGSASFIPTPRLGNNATRTSTHSDKLRPNGSAGSSRPAVRGIPVGGTSQNNHSGKQKDSMLEKLKIFNKEKESKSKNSGSSGVSKRTSSSSGFSSARSERSDSSTTSLCSDTRPPPLPPHQNLPGSTSSSSSDQAIGYPEQYISGKTPGLRGIRSRLSRGSKEGKESPKSSRRNEDRESSKGSPKSSHRNRGSESKEREREKDSRNHVNKRAENLTLNLNTTNSRNVQMVQYDVTSRSSKLASVTSSSGRQPRNQNPSSPQPGSVQGVVVGNNTGIPKPTAAVKGTSKVTPEKMSPVSPNINTPTVPKEYQNKMVKPSISPTPAVRRPPIGCEAASKPESKDPRDFKSSLPRQRNLGRREDGGSPSVAMVSPMPISGSNLNQVSASESGSALSEASHNSGHSNSSGGSSVIFKPNSEDEIAAEQLAKDTKAEEGDEIVDIQPMQPLLRAAQYGLMRGLGTPQNNRVLPPSLHVSKLNLQENSHTVPLKGMKISSSHLKNGGLSRLQQGYIVNTEYSDLECIDLATGYLSDGEILRPNIACNTYPGSELDGYMSEGGASLYAVRLNQRLQEGMRQVHESMNKVQHFIQDDSFDDSSSLSSGVSDTLNEFSEEILSSSLSSDHTAALAHARGIKDVGLKLPVGLSGASPRKAAMGMDPSGIYKVVSSKAHVKKTDCAQQSENFKQISNTQWKKYVEPEKANFNVVEYQRSLDLNESKKPEQKRTHGAPPGSSMGHVIEGNSTAAYPSPPNNGRRQDKKMIGREQQKGVIIPVASLQLNGDSKKIQNPKMISANFGFKKSGSGSAGSGSAKCVNKSPKDLNGANGAAGKDASSHSLDRPRTKLKVSGGTQTTSDLQYMPTAGFHSDGEYSSSNSLGRKYQQMKSYSLNGPAAAQLSQGVRERILQSPYRKVHMGGDINAYVGGVYYRERSPRMKVTDGSLSDNPYSNYAELQYNANPYGNSYSWVTRGNYATSVASAPARHLGGSLTEAESLESVSSSNSSFAAQLQHARATNLTQARLMMHQREMSTSPSPRLARSNSVRSTKSDKLLGMREGYHNSQPTSPTPPSCNRLPMSPLNTARGSPYYPPVVTRTSKDDECHGSSLSLVSSSSSLYSSQEDKQAAEVRKLRRDLTDAQDRVHTLTNQLTTNAHVVAAFEQSLTNMTNRLHHLTATSEQKDSELSELRRTIDSLRQQSIEAGLTVASFQSMSKENGGKVSNPKLCQPSNKHPDCSTPTKASACQQSPITKPPPHPYPPSNNASCSALNVCPTRTQPKSPEKYSAPDYARRHTFTGTCRDIVASEVRAPHGGNMVRGSSAESVSSLSSACSGTSHNSTHDKSDVSKSSKKKGWLRSSFTKAFSRASKSKQKSAVSSDAEENRDYEDISVPPSPLPSRGETEGDPNLSDQSLPQDEKTEEIESLKRQLWEKDMVLTDIRLEALTSAHQLDSLKETLNKMRSEMKNLKDDNDRLQRMMSSKSLNSSRSSIPVADPTLEHRLSVTEDIITIDDTTDVLLIDPLDKESKRVTISVFQGCHGDYDKYRNPPDGVARSECVVGAISVSGKTKWDTLDSLVKRIFKEYLLRVDPSSNLGINTDSILTYHLGEITRGRNSTSPELLPCGYLIGEVSTIQIVLKGAVLNCVDALALEILTSKSIMQRYVSLLSEHRRIILSGSSGTGKSFLAHKLAEYLVCRLGKDPSPENIATFSVDHKTSKDLGAYLSHVSDQCESNAADLPLVIILDNLHYAGALTEVFNGFLSAKYTQCPFIVGTMIQATSCSTTNLQLHHNFRWVLMANHMEPVKGLLAKVSRKKLTRVEVETFTRQPRLQQVLDWLPKCWAHINKFLETHSSSDVTIGPRLFLSCPGSVEGSQVWFTDLWNYSLVPYIVEAVREGLQLYGRRSSWEDPTVWIHETYPWPNAGNKALVGLRPDDVGYDSASAAPAGHDKSKKEVQTDNDPLLSMLMRLQEAANFSSPQQDAASVSIENMENALESTL